MAWANCGCSATAWTNCEAVPQLPDEYLVEIGRVSVEWSILEGVMDLCLIRLVGKDLLESRSHVLFTHMAFPMKLDIIGALVSELLPKYSELSGYPQVERSLKEAQQGRNTVIHGRWGLNDKTGRVEVSRISSRGKLKLTSKPITVQEIRQMADLISSSAQDLVSLVTGAGPGGSPEQ